MTTQSPERNTREIPEHKHTHSLYVHCLACQMFGTPMPTKYMDAVECGNCGSIETVKYYPSCCIEAERASKPTLVLPDESSALKYMHENGNWAEDEDLVLYLAWYRMEIHRLNAPTVSEGKCEPDTVWEGYLLDDNLLVRDSFNNWVETLGETEASYRIEAYKLPESGTGGE